MQNNEQQDCIVFSDDEIDDESAEPQILQTNVEEGMLQQSDLRKLEHGSNELLYILFTYYRSQLQKLASTYNCKIRLSMSTYLIYCGDQKNSVNFKECLSKISQFVHSITIIELQTKPNPMDATKLCYSPYIKNILKQSDVTLTKFHNKTYGFSQKLAVLDIKQAFLKLSKNKQIFTVRCFSHRSIQRSNIKDILDQITVYVKKMIQHYSEFFEQRKIVVQFNTNGSIINIIGEKSKYLMECKSTIKNILESMVCLFVKNTTVHQKNLKKFLQKAIDYPYHYTKLTNNTIILISKDNIIRQITSKSANLLKYLGIKIQDSQGKPVKTNPTIGIYLIPTISLQNKIKNIKERIRALGYDIHSNYGVKFLHRVFNQQEIDSPSDLFKKLIIQLMQAVQEKKNRFDIIKKIGQNKPYSQPTKVNPLKYLIVGGRQQDSELSKFLRRDVLSQKIQMKKQFMIAFNVIEGKDQQVYWIFQNSGEKGLEIKKENLTVGQYLKGIRRTSQTDIAQIYVCLINVI